MEASQSCCQYLRDDRLWISGEYSPSDAYMTGVREIWQKCYCVYQSRRQEVGLIKKQAATLPRLKIYYSEPGSMLLQLVVWLLMSTCSWITPLNGLSRNSPFWFLSYLFRVIFALHKEERVASIKLTCSQKHQCFHAE